MATTTAPPGDPEPDAADSAAPSAAPAATSAECAELALGRSFLHQLLARAFEYPTPDTWHWLCHPETQAACSAACQALDPATPSALTTRGQNLAAAFQTKAFDASHDDYLTAIGHAARGSCPINEIEYGDLKADPLFQPHRLADLAAFYHAFGLEVCSSAGERQDHLSVELEFMSVLTAQEAMPRFPARPVPCADSPTSNGSRSGPCAPQPSTDSTPSSRTCRWSSPSAPAAPRSTSPSLHFSTRINLSPAYNAASGLLPPASPVDAHATPCDPGIPYWPTYSRSKLRSNFLR